jgi:two-component system CheB/CheR fusion protein
MVYGFAKQSGGHVAIYSEIGHGTTVNLFLPTIGERKGESVDATPKHAAKAGGETILVVEDDPKVLRLTVARLKELNYQVVEATNGPRAMTILNQRDDIDLVLSDVVMPGGMTGFDVVEQALALRPELKVLLATGYAKGIEPSEAASAHAEYKILRKPYGLQELARTLRELLD